MSYVEPYCTTHSSFYTMPPKTTTSTRKQNSENLLPFRTTSPDAKLLRQFLTATPQRYLTDVKCLRKPAEVTDKVRKVHARFLQYCRDSMKGGVARIMKEDDIREEIVKKLEGNAIGGGDDDDDDDDEIVSKKK